MQVTMKKIRCLAFTNPLHELCIHQGFQFIKFSYFNHNNQTKFVLYIYNGVICTRAIGWH